MTRKEEIEQKANELSKIAFPDERNIWARPNLEAKVVKSCCISIAEWADRTMIDKVYKYLYRKLENGKKLSSQLIDDLRKENGGISYDN